MVLLSRESELSACLVPIWKLRSKSDLVPFLDFQEVRGPCQTGKPQWTTTPGLQKFPRTNDAVLNAVNALVQNYRPHSTLPLGRALWQKLTCWGFFVRFKGKCYLCWIGQSAITQLLLISLAYADLLCVIRIYAASYHFNMFACQFRHFTNFIKRKSKINALHVFDSDTQEKNFFHARWQFFF